MMGELNYDSYCGLYCGACSIMMAYKTGTSDKLASFLSDEMGVELKCHGCKTDTVFVGCTMCPRRSCARERGVERCLACGDFPCNLYQLTDETQKFVDKLPHFTTVGKNLAAIQSMGVDHWLAEQDKQWRCPECQTECSWYAATCSRCGTDLEKNREFAGEFDKSAFGFLKEIKQSGQE